MSLVSEALRKARAEHQRRALESGQLPPAIAPAPRARTPVLPYLLLASFVAGSLGAALVLWVASSKPHGPTLSKATPATRPTTPPPPAAARSDLSEITHHPPRRPSPPPTVPAGPPAVASQPTPPPVPTLTAPTPTPLPTHPRPAEFVLEARTSGVHLRLEYLVYGAGKAFARINGQEVTPGSTVEGFTVAQILEDRVILERRGETVVLKVR